MSMPYVFVSYSRQQYYIAEQLAASLSANGLPAWLDIQEILPGADWQASIDQGIANCAAFILVASQSACRSAAVQHEIALARSAGKPIYLAVIQNSPLVKQLKDEASIIDCRFQFEAQIAKLAHAVQAGEHLRENIRSINRPLGDTMPFGRGKYLQLLFVALSYTIGTIALLINKQVIVYHALPQQLIPLLVLIAAPVSAWLICLFYSWYLVFAFRRQRPLSFTTLELWPTFNLVLIPALFFFLDMGFLIRQSADQKILHEGATYLMYFLNIDERFSANSLVFSALVLIPYGFVLLSKIRSCLFLFFGALAFILPAALPFPLIWKLGIFALLGCILVAGLLWDFLRGNAVQTAFDGDPMLPTRFDAFVIAFGVGTFILTPIWFLPIYVTFRVLLILLIPVAVFILYLRYEQQKSVRRTASRNTANQTDQRWAQWLTPGAFNTERYRSINPPTLPATLNRPPGARTATSVLDLDIRRLVSTASPTGITRAAHPLAGETTSQRITPAASSDVATWSVLSTAADTAVAREIREVFAQHPKLHEVAPEQAQYHLLVLSNTTPRRWIAEQEARFLHSVCIITAPVNISALGISLQQNQFVDYRLRHPAALQYLAQAITGELNVVNPTFPEDFRRSRGPYPLRLVGLGLRLLGALNLIVGAGTMSVMQLASTPQHSYPLAALSIAMGVWCFWEAERSQMRRTTLAMLLLTVAASIAILVYWLFSGAMGVLAPHGLFIENGDINVRINTAMTFVFTLVSAPLAVFVVAALIEMVRKVAILRRWLPGVTWRVWRKTLGVSPIHNINISYGVYGLGVTLSVLLLFVDSPLHYPRFHEYSLADAGLHAQQFAVAPNGNVWFETSGKTYANYKEYHIGYITPGGDLHPDYYSVTEPSGCDNHAKAGFFDPFECISGAGFRLGPDGSLWFATSQGSFDATVFIIRITPNGQTRRIPMPARTFIPRMQFAFDGAGNLWYLRLAPRSLSQEQAAIGRIDAANNVEEFALPDNSSPFSLVRGPDGNMWVTLTGEAAIARITPSGSITKFALPTGIKPVEMLIGSDHTFWFTAPDSATIGRMTTKGVVTTVTLPAHTNPVDLTMGTDGTIWYIDTQLDQQRETIGRVMADGSVRTYDIAALPTSGSTLVAAPDGGMWVTLYNQIGHIAGDGSVKLYATPTLDADLGPAILVGNHLLFSEYTGIIGVFAT